MRVGRAFLQTFTVQVVQSAASVATGVLIARGLGPAEQGRYALFSAAVALGAVLVALGQFQGNVLSTTEQPGSGRILLLRSILHCLAVLAVLTILHGAGLTIPGLSHLGDLTYAFIAVLFVEALAQMVRGINLGQHDVTSFNLGTFSQRAIYLGLVVLLRQTSALALMPIAIAWFGAALLSLLLISFLVWKRSPSGHVSWLALRAGWGTGALRGLRALITVMLSLFLVRCDIYMLGPMLGMAAVGQVSVATGLAEWLWYVPSILSNLLFAASAADARTRRIDVIARATRSLVLFLVPACVVLMCIGKWLVHLLYGPAYLQAGTVFLLLLPGVTALALHLVVDSYFAGSGFPAITIWAPALALGVKVALNLALVPRWGILGAAWATSLVYIGLFAIKAVALSREVSIPLSALLRPTWKDTVANIGSARAWVLRRA